MEPPTSRHREASGIPRLSRLPLPRSTASALPQGSDLKISDREATRATTRIGHPPPRKSTAVKQTIPHKHTEVARKTVPVENGQSYENAIPEPSARRRPRPSLSDRTAETLAQIPPSPSPRKRRSSFFQTDSPMISPIRPSSSMARARPSTSMGIHPPLPDRSLWLRPSSPEKRPLHPGAGNSTPKKTPQKSATGPQIPRSLPHPRSSLSRTTGEVSPLRTRPPVPPLHSKDETFDINTPSKTDLYKPRGFSRTLGARSTPSRPSAQEAFGISGSGRPRPQKAAIRAESGQAPGTISSRTSSGKPAIAHRPLKTPSASVPADSPGSTPQKSSASLRETIAKAKAERQAAIKAQSQNGRRNVKAEGAFEDFDLASSNKGLLKKRIQQARSDGRLNIAAMGLSGIPPEVLNMYDAPALDSKDGAWYESVDLVRLVAADNEIEILDDIVFPDIEAGSSDNFDEDFKGNMFGGIETLDLHGNRLLTMPQGIRRLTNLTVINLSKNKLGNESLAIVSHVQSLRELRMAENAFEGPLDAALSNFQHLEILDLSNNKISTLPNDLGMLSSLQTLLLSGNALASLPSILFVSNTLSVLDVSRNRLIGTFASHGMNLPLLKSLDVSQNALTSIANGPIFMARLESLNVAENRIEELPDLSHSPRLITLTASGNKIKSIHENLVTLQDLKNVDLSRNDLRTIDERFGLLQNLTMLHVANNPLRDRKYLTLNTEDLKRELRMRALPAQDDADQSEGLPSSDSALDPRSSTSANNWSVKPGGILERSSTGMATLEATELEQLIAFNDIKIMKLQGNHLTQLPPSLTLLASTLNSLDISNNKLSTLTFINSMIALPQLRTLDMSQNTITSLTPLLEHLDSPKLAELNVSRNRLIDLPPLRTAFPFLTTIQAADNHIANLTVETVQGLEVLDVSGNEIMHLEPKLGLLADAGLRTLLVGANRFRVPRRDIVEKGTGAVLAWLRGRISE